MSQTNLGLAALLGSSSLNDSGSESRNSSSYRVGLFNSWLLE